MAKTKSKGLLYLILILIPSFLDNCSKSSDTLLCNPLPVGNITSSIGKSIMNAAMSVFVLGNYAYVASLGNQNLSALEIVDVSNPSIPLHKGSLMDGVGGALLTGPKSVYVVGNYAYVAGGGSNALEIVDVTDPAAPVHKGSITNGMGGAKLEGPLSVFVSGNYAYVTSQGSATDVGKGTLEIVDVSDPAAPVHKSSMTNGDQGALLYYPNSIFVSGNYAFIASTGSSALEIIDVTNPATPSHKSSLTDGVGGALLNHPSSVYISGTYAYLGAEGNLTGVGSGLEIVDISNPAAPVHKGKTTAGSGNNGQVTVFVSGSYLYKVSQNVNSLDVFDVSNPSVPALKGRITDLSGTDDLKINAPSSVFVAGGYIYVTSLYENALQILLEPTCK